MDLMKYMLPRPPLEITPQMAAACERQLAALEAGEADYFLEYPKWQFLACIAETRPVVFHGTRLRSLAVVEPRQSNDVQAFGAQNAIYATDDAIWALFFAILDRPRMPMSLTNAAVRLRLPGGELSQPYYFFSITRQALEQGAFCDGAVYILPRETFEHDPVQKYGGYEIEVPQWASRQPAAALARLAVAPGDFPFLAQVRGHDDDVQQERIRRDPEGFPWINEQVDEV